MPPRHPSIAHALGLVRRTLRTLAGDDSPSVLVACSGGADSVALLGLLQLLADGDGLELSVGHVDHGLRPTSAREAEGVAELAERLGLRLQTRRLFLDPGPALADRARRARHRALRQMAHDAGAGIIALGHTATDQAETVLLNLTRGAGLGGMAGMVRTVAAGEHRPALVRPLLDLTRHEVRTLAQRLELPFVDDPTNDDLRHPRVWMRAEVLPRLERLRGGAVQALAGAADRLREAEDALDAWASAELRSRMTEPGAARAEGMSRLPRAVRTRMVRSLLREAGVQRDAVGRRLIDQVDRALCNGSDSSSGPRRIWDIGARRRLRLDGGCLRLDQVGDDPHGSARRSEGDPTSARQSASPPDHDEGAERPVAANGEEFPEPRS